MIERILFKVTYQQQDDIRFMMENFIKMGIKWGALGFYLDKVKRVLDADEEDAIIYWIEFNDGKRAKE